MDLQTRKINFIQEFLKIKNEDIVVRFERLLKQEKNNLSRKNIKPMTIKELNKRINQSLADSENNKLTEINDLVDEIQKWG